MAASAAPAGVDADAVAFLASKFPDVSVDVIQVIVGLHGSNVMAAHEELAANHGSPTRTEKKHSRGRHRKAKSKSKAKSKRSSGHSARRAEREAEKRKLERKLAAHLASGRPESEFRASLEAECVSRLIDVGNTSEIVMIHPPRPGLKLLVLDMDYTLFDHLSEGDVRAMKRPYLDEFLAAVYKHYDLAVWSQTHWRRLEAILTALGVLTSPLYRLSFVVDARAMTRVSLAGDDGAMAVHEVKDLHLIWGKFPDAFNPCNTLHIDDLPRNFAMNPANGIVIPPFTAERRLAQSDNSLRKLKRYLLSIRDTPDVTSHDHRVWESFPGDSDSDTDVFDVSSLDDDWSMTSSD